MPADQHQSVYPVSGEPTIMPLGEHAWLWRFPMTPTSMSQAAQAQIAVWLAQQASQLRQLPGVEDAVSAYQELAIYLQRPIDQTAEQVVLAHLYQLVDAMPLLPLLKRPSSQRKQRLMIVP